MKRAAPAWRLPFRVGNIRYKLGAAAGGRLRPRCRVFAPLAANCPSVPPYRQHLAGSHHNLATCCDSWPRKEAETEYRDALALENNWPPTSPPSRLPPGTWPQPRQPGRSARMHWPAEGGGGSIPQCLALEEQLAADFPTVPDTARTWPAATIAWAICLATGRRKEAEAAYRDARQSTSNWPPTSPPSRVPPGPGREATTTWAPCSRQGGLKEAEAAYRDALAIEKQLAADFPAVPEYRRTWP